MAAPATIDEFFDVCRKSGVVEEGSLSGLSGPATSSPLAAAKTLIRTGVLTKFQAGQLLAGKYKGLRFDRLKILDRIGAGGMGTVFLCEHLGLRKQVAVKVLPPDQAGDEGTRERFFREARAAASLDHPNIVRVHDMNSTGGVHYIVMEFVDGQDLQTMVNKYGPLPYSRACGYIAQAAMGLEHAHEKGMVHRDIKPANLLVDKDGVVKILDMGLARFHADEKDNLTAKYDKGAVLGTADYMAPEQILESSSVDIRADIYSLGVTMYTLINGKPPFGGSCTQKLMGHQIQKATSLTEIRREVPKGLSAVVDKMMAKAPSERFQTPGEVLEALTPWLEMDTVSMEGQQTRKMPGTTISRRRPFAAMTGKSRMPLIVAGVAASAVLFGGLGVWALTGGDKSNTATVAAAPENQVPPSPSPPQIPASTPTPPQPAPSTPPAPDQPRQIYEIDFARVGEFQAKFEDKKRTGMVGAYPPGWSAQSWRVGATAEVGIQSHLGHKAAVIRTISGDGGSAELQTAHGATPFKFIPGRQYILRTEYAIVGAGLGSFELRFDGERPPVKNAVPLRPTQGEWQTVELRFTTPTHERVALFYTHARGVAPDFMVVRSLKVLEQNGDGPAPPSPVVRPQVVWEHDFSRSVPFRGTMAKPGGLKMDDGKLPSGWSAYVWKQGSAGEIGLETYAGKSGVGFRTTSGDASAELTTHSAAAPRDRLKAGKRYRLEVEYAVPGGPGGRLDVRLDDPVKPGNILVRLPATGAAWRTAGVDFTVPNDRNRPLSAFLSNLGFGPDNTLYIRTMTLLELSDGPRAMAPATGFYRLSLAGAKSFARRYRLETVTESQGDGELPAPWAAHTQNAATLGDVFIDPVGGQPALGLRNDEGPPSVRLFTRSALLQARAGKTYAVKVTYQTEANGKGGVLVAVNGSPAGRRDLATSVGNWTAVEMTVTPAADGPLTMSFECGSVGSESSVFIRDVEVRELA